MFYEHDGHRPNIHPTASIAPSAIISGHVVIESETRVLHGAIVTAQGGEVRIGSRCVVMETITTYEYPTSNNQYSIFKIQY